MMLAVNVVFAAPNKDQQKREAGLNKTAAGCNATTATIDLDVNNVRARLMNGGDMWWDRSTGTAQYEVPKGSNKNALFAGSVWIGGFDRSTNDLKVAAQTYRQSGNDFWSGPLDLANASSIDFQTCADWDRFWKINATDANVLKNLYNIAATNNPGNAAAIRAEIVGQSGLVPDVVKEWPARGNVEAKSSSGSVLSIPNRQMAPFEDVNNDNVYSWRDGDYPLITGDQFIWWVYNDKGDAKTETLSDAIGVEIHASAFAFSTNDCLNEATFYNYRVHNWGTAVLDSTYMATWTDADMGNAFDDYIGCDTTRGLGILYNGDAYDETSTGYGFDIPMVGIDFFRGPRYSLGPGLGDTELGMTVFTYYDNNFSFTGNPETLDDFYGYMTGTWKNNTTFKEGCNPTAATGVATKFVFPDDPCKGGISEPDCGRQPFDRRFTHSSGPFSLVPGSNPSDITIGAVWVPNAGSGKSACFGKLQVCDDKAQKLFDDDFKLKFGPQAPKMNVQPLDRKLVVTLENLRTSNNYKEYYGNPDLTDPEVVNPSYYREDIKKASDNGFADSLYKFEGYIVYQLRDANVSVSDIREKDGSINTDLAQIVFQSDKQNGVKELLNYEIDPEISETFYVPKLMVTGADQGIKKSFEISSDLFSTTASKDLVNYKTYYYVAVAYAYNRFDNADSDILDNDFDPQNANFTNEEQYLESRTDGRELPINVVAVMAHPAKDSLYVQNYAEFGTGIPLTRIEGVGNSGIALEMSQASIDEALTNGAVYFPKYEGNASPAEIFVVNPDSIKAGNYELFLDVDSSYANANVLDTTLGAYAPETRWHITNLSTGETIYSEKNIVDHNEQYLRKYNNTGDLIADWGIAVSLKQTLRPGDNDSIGDNGFITSSMLVADANAAWLFGVRDQDGESTSNWIRAGEDAGLTLPNGCDVSDYGGRGDRGGNFENIIDGTWSPYNMVGFNNLSECGFGYLYNTSDRVAFARMQNLNSVDVVFTDDQSLWTRCPVIEMTDNVGTQTFSQGGAYKFNMRKHPAWDKQVDGNGQPVYHPTDSGYSWFPGYAINLETGQRLNMMFGEESFNAQDNGNDMIWNPSERQFDFTNFSLKWGGKHVIYVQNTQYDSGNLSYNYLKNAWSEANSFGSNNFNLRQLYRSVMWVGNPLSSGFKPLSEGLIPTETQVKIRVERPYHRYLPQPGQTARNGGWPLYGFETYDIAPATLGDGRNLYTDNKDEILKRIQPVPNPYYAYSEYELDRLDTKVRIINLPAKATIKIYSVDGALIRTLIKNDEAAHFIDWDVKNQQGIPIASGMYLMHVELDGIGETVLKWFGAMRPADLTSF